jgi:hypothetical protein
MADDNPRVTLHFGHPTDSSQVLTATVGTTATPDYLINKLIQSGFMSKLLPGAVYKLVDTETGKELNDHVSLAAAGVASGSTLMVLHSVTGA